MLSLKHLQKSFRGIPVLTEVNAEIRQGEAVALIGQAGAGKSTLLRCLNLLERPDSGEIHFHGENILASGTDREALRRKIGMVSPQFPLFPGMNVLNNVALAPRVLSGKSRKEACQSARELLSEVGLAAKATAFPEELSDGQKQRVAIARALAMQPEIMLFDDPTSSPDRAMGDEVLKVLRNLAQSGMTMIIATDEMRVAREIATRVLFMEHGAIIEEGTPEEILNNPQQASTRAFMQHFDKFNMVADKDGLDLYHFNALVEEFATRQRLSKRLSNNLRLVVEELLVNLLWPHVTRVNLEIAISEDTQTTEITARWQGWPRNPLEDEDAHRTVIRELCRQKNFVADAAHAPTLQLTLIPDN